MSKGHATKKPAGKGSRTGVRKVSIAIEMETDAAYSDLDSKHFWQEAVSYALLDKLKRGATATVTRVEANVIQPVKEASKTGADDDIRTRRLKKR